MKTENKQYTSLFTGSKSAYYDDYRPRYADQLFRDLDSEGVVPSGASVVDVGCGTGILSQQLIQQLGCRVTGVEPNASMRAHVSQDLAENSAFCLVDGSAEQTGLVSGCADAIVSGQAFHWFDPDGFKAECHRLLRNPKDGWVVLVWNRKAPCEMESARKRIVEKYRQVVDAYSCSWAQREQGISSFFNGNFDKCRYDNPLVETYEQFINRTLSASHALQEDDERIEEYLRDWKEYFDTYSVDGKIVIPNETVAYWGKIGD